MANSTTIQLIRMALKKAVGDKIQIATAALIEIGAESLIDEFLLKNYRAGQRGAVTVDKEALEPFLAKDGDPEKPLKIQPKKGPKPKAKPAAAAPSPQVPKGPEAAAEAKAEAEAK